MLHSKDSPPHLERMVSSLDFISGLNPQQQEAVRHVDGPLLILAGAGSGKTRVITHRIAHLMTAHGVPGYAILAVTFTNKAAGEMKERVARLLARQTDLPDLATFHSFCVRLLRRDGARLADLRPGFTRQFNIYDDDDQLALVKQICRQMAFDDKTLPPRQILSRISQGKNAGESATDLAKSPDRKVQMIAATWEKYEQGLVSANALDFDDLLLQSVQLLAHDEDVRTRWGRRLRFLMIDEYQDTNRAQYDLIRLLTREHQNLAVVGDEDQSIYGWRGATIRNILDFEKDYPDARIIRLEQNYRSTKNILAAASAVVANNEERKGKTLWTEAGAGAGLSLFEAYDGEQEALWVADTIDKVMDRDAKARVAVLYRTNFQSRQLEEALRRYGRKYVVLGGISFYQRAEIKDMLSYLRLLTTPHDSIALNRIINVPARGIGKTTMEQIETYAAQNGLSLWTAISRMLQAQLFSARAHAALNSFVQLIVDIQETMEKQGIDQVIHDILERTGYKRQLQQDHTPEAESRLQNLEELINAAADSAQRNEGVAEFLDHAALVAQTDDLDDKASISLMTMHNSKGLEFPYVFVVGMEEGLFPSQRSQDNRSLLEEERRLCYVALTRAEKQLFLSNAKMRRRYGGGLPEPTMPSRFLKEIPRELVQRVQPGKYQEDFIPQVNLAAEQMLVRESVKKTTYTGKTYNSVENISQFFKDRGVRPPGPPAPVATKPAAPVPPSPPRFEPATPAPRLTLVRSNKPKGLRSGLRVSHPKYGRGTILRVEGEGEEAKLTVSFASAGLKKMVAKFAGITIEE